MGLTRPPARFPFSAIRVMYLYIGIFIFQSAILDIHIITYVFHYVKLVVLKFIIFSLQYLILCQLSFTIVLGGFDMNTLQKLLKNKRKELKLSIRKAADLIGISHSYLNILEKGVDPRTNAPIKPTPETLSLISEAYKIDYNELMIAAGYIAPQENVKVYNPEESEKAVDDMLNYYRSLQLSNLILSLSPENQKRAIDYIKMLKFSEEQGLNLDE